MTEARRTLLKARQDALRGRINMAACANHHDRAVFTKRTCRTCIGHGVLPAEFGGEIEIGAETYPCYSCQPATANL
jgi:hypothetical protein